MALFVRQNALSGIKRAASTEPLLPFLYNTRTIRTQYTDALSDFENEQELKARQNSRRHGRDTSFRRSDRRERPNNTVFRKLDLGNNGHESYANEQSEEPQDRPRRHQRVDHIPFEEPAQETNSIRAQLEGSTMTPSERKAFEELLSMPKKVENNKRVGGEPVPGESTDDIMSKLQAERVAKRRPAYRMPEELQRMIREHHPDEGAEPGAKLAAAMTVDKQQLEKAFEEAQTDVELWKVLHDKVFSRVLALNLDAPPAPVESKKKKNRKSKKEEAPKEAVIVNENVPTWDEGITDEMVITQNFPRHLVAFQKYCRTVFPSSQLPLALLPYLKTLGPATYALGAGTSLYNQHMRSLYAHDLDLPSVLNTLEDMDKDVFEHDHRSLRLLEIILKKSRSARLGFYGPGLAALWDGERFRKARGSAIQWSETINERMKELALAEARAKEESPVSYY